MTGSASHGNVRDKFEESRNPSVGKNYNTVCFIYEALLSMCSLNENECSDEDVSSDTEVSDVKSIKDKLEPDLVN